MSPRRATPPRWSSSSATTSSAPTVRRGCGRFCAHSWTAPAAQAGPVAYLLEVDFFEDQRTAPRAWEELALTDFPARPRLDRVLAASGPVPWVLKAPVYERLFRDPSWHEAVFASLADSALQVYGQIDGAEATTWLRRIVVPANAHERHGKLLTALG